MLPHAKRCYKTSFGIADMKSFLHKLIILSCALYLSGAHWVVLQGTAWTGMVISRSLTTSVAEAVSSTFDGQHPCPVCSAITEGRCNEEGAGTEFSPVKKSAALKFIELVSELAPEGCGPVSTAVWPSLDAHPASRVEAPWTPPPIV
jgi:hypothetical protein